MGPSWPLLALAGLTVVAVAAWTAGPRAPRDPAADRLAPASVHVQPADPGVGSAHDLLARRRQVARAVLDAGLGLLPAAARFRDLAAGSPAESGHLRRMYPGGTDDERHARAVIRWVRAELGRRGAGDGPAARLEAELAELLAAGTLALPDPPPG